MDSRIWTGLRSPPDIASARDINQEPKAPSFSLGDIFYRGNGSWRRDIATLGPAPRLRRAPTVFGRILTFFTNTWPWLLASPMDRIGWPAPGWPRLTIGRFRYEYGDHRSDRRVFFKRNHPAMTGRLPAPPAGERRLIDLQMSAYNDFAYEDFLSSPGHAADHPACAATTSSDPLRTRSRRARMAAAAAATCLSLRVRP